jgi:predicted metal-binding membrane protein
MWSVMMVGMMLPSAAPVILLVVGAYRRRGGRGAQLCTIAFTVGYLAAWTGFSAAAALAQTALHAAALLSGAMASKSAVLAGGIFVVAGAYQWAPWKYACLSHCRSPLHFLSQEWREGALGAFRMGLRHGVFCVGCCWALMVILFAAGVMNLLWVAAIAAFVLVEKLLPGGPLVGRATGALLIAWGTYLMAAAALV